MDSENPTRVPRNARNVNLGTQLLRGGLPSRRRGMKRSGTPSQLSQQVELGTESDDAVTSEDEDGRRSRFDNVESSLMERFREVRTLIESCLNLYEWNCLGPGLPGKGETSGH